MASKKRLYEDDDDEDDEEKDNEEKSDENVVLIGTPIKIDKTSATKMPIWKQEARDEKGKRRFHGAFTGGFTAGYNNSVGSLEGFVPTTFMSSRTQRSSANTQSTADFMDEDDLRDLRGELGAKDKFSSQDGPGANSSARELESANSLIASKLAEVFVGPNRSPIGVQLLQKLGWKHGQGVGPRKRRRLDDEDDVDDTSSATSDQLLAPKNTTVMDFVAKNNLFGLGFDAHENAPEFADRNSSAKHPKLSSSTKMRFGADFDTQIYGDDDEDLDKGTNQYTFKVGDEHSKKTFESASHTQQTTKSSKKALKPSVTVPQRCHDGRPPLRRFKLASKALNTALTKWFEPPVIPESFTGVQVTSLTSPEVAVNISKPGQIARALGIHTGLAADDRAHLLGESVPTRSALSFVSSDDRTRLEEQKKLLSEGQNSEAQPKPPLQTTLDVITAQRAMQGFMPFGIDPAKQARYRRYLEYHSAPDNPQRGVLDISEQEMQEFCKTATIFKPMSSVMAARFTTSQSSIDLPAPQIAGLRSASSLEPKQANQSTQSASSSKKPLMIGRETISWEPARLLCKRFNVAPPSTSVSTTAVDPRSTSWKAVRATQLESKEAMLMDDMRSLANIPPPPPPVSNESENADANSAAASAEEWALSERPSMDLFKAIFEDDDEEEEKDKKKDQPEKTDPPPAVVANAPVSAHTDEDDMIGPFPLISSETNATSDANQDSHQPPTLREPQSNLPAPRNWIKKEQLVNQSDDVEDPGLIIATPFGTRPPPRQPVRSSTVSLVEPYAPLKKPSEVELPAAVVNPAQSTITEPAISSSSDDSGDERNLAKKKQKKEKHKHHKKKDKKKKDKKRDDRRASSQTSLAGLFTEKKTGNGDSSTTQQPSRNRAADFM